MANELLKLDMSYEKIMSDTMADLADTGINHVSPGSVAKLLLSKVNKQVSSFYEKLDLGIMQAFLSKATDGALDLIGAVTNCTRYDGESDENYKYRISRQPLSLEKGNETAIRLAILSIPDVKDVILRPFSFGTGSFSVYPIVDNPRLMTPEFLQGIDAVLSGVRSFGVRASVLPVRLAPVEMRAHLLFDERVPQIERSLTVSQVTDYIRTHLASMLPGDTLSPDTMKKEIKKIDERIMNIEFYHFRINDRPMVAVDQTSAWNEQFVEAETVGSIVVS